jgi:hypothetical protein
MQKVEGSSPFIRSHERPRKRGLSRSGPVLYPGRKAGLGKDLEEAIAGSIPTAPIQTRVVLRVRQPPNPVAKATRSRMTSEQRASASHSPALVHFALRRTALMTTTTATALKDPAKIAAVPDVNPGRHVVIAGK